MARGPRLDAPGSLPHVIVRGIERKETFRDDRDREGFLGRLGEIVQEEKASCFDKKTRRTNLQQITPADGLQPPLIYSLAPRYARR